jgi:hypothetical protein
MDQSTHISEISIGMGIDEIRTLSTSYMEQRGVLYTHMGQNDLHCLKQESLLGKSNVIGTSGTEMSKYWNTTVLTFTKEKFLIQVRMQKWKTNE